MQSPHKLFHFSQVYVVWPTRAIDNRTPTMAMVLILGPVFASYLGALAMFKVRYGPPGALVT